MYAIFYRQSLKDIKINAVLFGMSNPLKADNTFAHCL